MGYGNDIHSSDWSRLELSDCEEQTPTLFTDVGVVHVARFGFLGDLQYPLHFPRLLRYGCGVPVGDKPQK